MADRHLLHISKLKEFEKWLLENGWEIVPLKGFYERLRAVKPSRKTPLIVYKKDEATEHLTVKDTDIKIIRSFIKERRKRDEN
jgi:predicted RNA binding protein YcfA (HicA-like mRNA interferase family)